MVRKASPVKGAVEVLSIRIKAPGLLDSITFSVPSAIVTFAP